MIRMKEIKFLLLLMLLVGWSGQLAAQSAHNYLRKADKSYKGSDYKTAEEQYRKSLEKNSSVNGHYNLGNSIYQQKRFDEAVKQYEQAVDGTDNPEVKSNAYHNLGNAHFSNQAFDKSVEAYKNALRHNSNAMDTKQNLARALRMLKQQQQQKQQQQEEQEQQQDQEQEPNEEQNEDQQQQQQQQEQQEAKEKESEPQEKDLSKEEARKLLQIMENEERKVQEKMKNAKGRKPKSEKDW